MKLKRSLLTAMIAVSAFSLIGCSNNKTKEVPVAEIQAGIAKEELLPQAKEEIDAKEWWPLAEVKDKIVEGFASVALMNVKLQDVAVIKTTDTQAIVDALETYQEESYKLFAGGYGGEDNATAVANAVLEVKGDYVYFIATPNASDVEAELLKIIG